MDFHAIIRAYPNASYIDETVVKDKSGNVIETEQAKIDTARAAMMLNTQLLIIQGVEQPNILAWSISQT